MFRWYGRCFFGLQGLFSLKVCLKAVSGQTITLLLEDVLIKVCRNGFCDDWDI